MSGIIDKIRKLMNHAESARTIGNQAEAEAFAGKAADLQAQHKIDVSMLEFDDVVEEQIDVASFDLEDIYGSKTAVSWRSVLSRALAEANFCQNILVQTAWRGRKRLHVYGNPSDREVFLYTFRSLTETIERLSKGVAGGRIEKNAWRAGFAAGVSRALKAKRMEQERASNPHALVLVNARQAVEDALAKDFPKQRSSSARPNPAGYAQFLAGMEAGKAHNVTRGVGGAAGSRLALGAGK